MTRFSKSTFLQIKYLHFHQLFFIEHGSTNNKLHEQSLHLIIHHWQELFIYIWRLKNAVVVAAMCKNMFNETTHLLLILQQNDCHLQLLTKYVSQLQWVSQGVHATPKLHGKWVIRVGLEPKDFQVPAIPSFSFGQINEK